MQYGYFNDAKREYVITDPRTPMAWANYLGSPEYGAIVTQNAGGYSFVKSGAHGRILRYSFNQFDEPGRYVYLRDDENGDYWSASWRPVEKPLDQYKTITRHGTSYTEIESEYAGIKSQVLYYVPMNATHEVWRVKVTNNSDKVRTISAMSYCELTTESNYEQDLVNLQYTQFITNTTFEGDCIVQHINQFCGVNEKGENWRERVFALAGAPVKSYCGRREKFVGVNRFRNPQAVINGDLGNVLNFNGNPCGALHAQLVLQPGETKTIAFLLMQKAPSVAREVIDRYADTDGKSDKQIDDQSGDRTGGANRCDRKTAAESAAASASSAEQASAALDTLVDDTVITPDTLWSSDKIISYLCETFTQDYISADVTHGGGTLSFNPVPNSTLRVTVDIDANQMYQNTPAPTDSNPLQGWSSVSLTLTAGTNTASYDFDLGGTFYGGTLDCNTGLFTVKRKVQFFDGTEDWKTCSVDSVWHPILPINSISPNPNRKNRYTEKCSHYAFCKGTKLDGGSTGICTTGDGIEIYDPSYTQEDPTAWKNWLVSLNANGDPFHVVVNLNEPYTIQLEPAQTIAFAGTNSMNCSIGNFLVSYKQDFRYELQQIKDAITALQS